MFFNTEQNGSSCKQKSYYDIQKTIISNNINIKYFDTFVINEILLEN